MEQNAGVSVPSRGKVAVLLGTIRVSVPSGGKVTVFFGTKRVSVPSGGKVSFLRNKTRVSGEQGKGGSLQTVLALRAAAQCGCQYTVYSALVGLSVRTRGECRTYA